MQDADATGELDPVGRISVHEDANNDGIYEKHSVFVDKLVFPRFVLPIGANAILTMESNADEVWKFTDTNGDGVADKKELFATNFGRSRQRRASAEPSLRGAMDNWMYSTYNAFRIRWTPNGVQREPTGIERRTVGRDAGQLRQDVLPGRRQRHARLLPVSDPLRELRGSRSLRTESQHHLGRPDADRRHAGRPADRADAAGIAGAVYRRRRRHDFSAAIVCPPI